MTNTFSQNFKSFLSINKNSDILTILDHLDDQIYHSFTFDLSLALAEMPQLKLMKGSIYSLIKYIETTVIELQQEAKQKIDSNSRVKDRILVQFSSIPAIPTFYLKSLGDINSEHINNLILVKGTKRIKSVDKVRLFKCTSCGFSYQIYSDSTQFHKMQMPLQCSNLVMKKPNPIAMFYQKFNKGKPGKQKQLQCGGRSFEPTDEKRAFLDYQEIKIQDTFSTLQTGTLSRSIFVMIEGDLVNNCKVGDDVIVGGVLVRRWKNDSKNQKPQISLWIDCKYLELQGGYSAVNTKEVDVVYEQLSLYSICYEGDILGNELKHREDLIKSICVGIFGQYQIKLGILLCLVGGVEQEQEGTQIRGNSHLLMIGEPGTGKSTLLRYANQLSERSVYTNGIGSTQAGLTVSYIREGSEWIIEAGALVLADQGICCIDEFNLIQKQQLHSVLEALEQQTVSSQKAGLMAKLNARVTLIAACNPVGPGQKYLPYLNLEENSGLMSPLLSRFDLIFILTDEINEASDRMSADHILNQFLPKRHSLQSDDQLYSEGQLKSYIKYVKSTYQPRMLPEAEDLIMRYYMKLRKKNNQKITVRKLESLVRLSQAHAKLMCREYVNEFDAISVICLNEASSGASNGVHLNADDYRTSKQFVQINL